MAAWIWRSIADVVSLATLCADLAAAPERRAQFDAHADALREAGVCTPTARVAAIQAALDAEAGSAT